MFSRILRTQSLRPFIALAVLLSKLIILASGEKRFTPHAS